MLTEQERSCLRELVARSSTPLAWIEGSEFRAALKIEEKTFLALLNLMEKFGYISQPMHTTGGMYTMFQVTELAFTDLREYDHHADNQKSPDLVEQFKDFIKRKPWIAWPLIAGICLTTIVTFVNQFLDLLAKCGVKFN